ncbi:DUF5017 domain-containing protein [Rufibacter immobilis]|uniref:DUF5017 domain-containing protein n=1 Tax=Rufibacter immobilis TaxID=1348778 RepID=A0A3M9MWK2_9BACT|nr:DUF5017 domain-containing protein [Rufibacter immobilis]RNI29924.1 DUF5017 domain-containing protein [Rufibacter immobilis]
MKFKYLFYLLLPLSFYSCQDTEVEAPTFDVKPTSLQYKLGDSVRFNFTGDPDFLTFYSGEIGKEYQNRDRVELTGGKLELEFETQTLYGRDTDYISLLASTNFSGTYTPEEVTKATWVDISNRFTFATAAPGAVGVRTMSGKVDVTDLLANGQPIYFAYKYVGKASTTTKTSQWLWRLYAFNVTNSFPNGNSTLVSTLATTDWVSVDFANPTSKWIYTSALVYFNPFSTLDASEEWAISKPFNPNKVTPDRGVAIKEFSRRKSSHAYLYSKPGTYKVVFVATNGTIDGQKSMVKELEITVLP